MYANKNYKTDGKVYYSRTKSLMKTFRRTNL